MSFTNEVKGEVARLDLSPNAELLKAELAAFIKMSGSFVLHNHYWKLILRSEHHTVVKHLYAILKFLYQIEPHILVMTKVKLKKNHVFQLEVRTGATDILADLSIDYFAPTLGNSMDRYIYSADSRKALLTGAFLASGSVNSPATSNYHFELSTAQEELALFLQSVLQRFDLDAKIHTRRTHYMVYLKKSEQIADFLRLINAPQAVLAFEEKRIERDQYISMSRIVNCEVANEVKSQESAKRQVAMVELIIERMGREFLEFKLQEVAELRLEYPEANLNELVEFYQEKTGRKISKSGLNHRFTRLREIAQQLERGTAYETNQ